MLISRATAQSSTTRGEPIIGAVVTPDGKPNNGVPTDIDGHFTIKVPDGTKKLRIEYVGMKPLTVAATSEIGTVKMEVSAYMLQDVVVTQSIARTRKLRWLYRLLTPRPSM